MREYSVVQSDIFKKNLKKYKKKHPSLTKDVYTLQQLLSFQQDGILLFQYNEEWNVYKIRLLCKSLRKGKSGGYRVIYIKNDSRYLILLVTLYFKSDIQNMTDDEIIGIISGIDFESL